MAIQDYLRFGLSGYEGGGSTFTGYNPSIYGIGGTGEAPLPGGGPIQQYLLEGGLDPYTETEHFGPGNVGGIQPGYLGPIEDPYEYLWGKGWQGLDEDTDYLSKYSEFMQDPEEEYEEDIQKSRTGWEETGMGPYLPYPHEIETLESGIQHEAGQSEDIRSENIQSAETLRESNIAGLGSLGDFGEAGTEGYEVIGGGTGTAGGFQSAYEQSLLQGSQARERATALMGRQEEELLESQEALQTGKETGFESIVKAGGLSSVDRSYGTRIEEQRKQLERGGISQEEQLGDLQKKYSRDIEVYETELGQITDVESAAKSDFETKLQNLGFTQDTEGGWNLAGEGQEAEGTELSRFRTAYQEAKDTENAEYEGKIENLNQAHREALNQGDNIEVENIERTKEQFKIEHEEYTNKLMTQASDLQAGALDRIEWVDPESRPEEAYYQDDMDKEEQSEYEECIESGGTWMDWGCELSGYDYGSGGGG